MSCRCGIQAASAGVIAVELGSRRALSLRYAGGVGWGQAVHCRCGMQAVSAGFSVVGEGAGGALDGVK